MTVTAEVQSKANRLAAAMIVASAVSEGDILTGEDGYAIYWPKGPGGAFSAWILRAIADELDRRNADWDATVQADLAQSAEASS